MADTKEEKIEQPDLIKNADGDRKIIFRKNLDRPLTSAEVDTNFLIVPEIVHEAMMEVGKSIWSYQTNIQKDILKNRATSKSNLKKIDKNIEDVKSLKEQITNIPISANKEKNINHTLENSCICHIPIGNVSFSRVTNSDDSSFNYGIKSIYIDFSVRLKVEVGPGVFSDFVEFIPNVLINLDNLESTDTVICNFFKFIEDGSVVNVELLAKLNSDLTASLSFKSGVYIKEFETKLSFNNSVLFNDTDEDIIVES